MENGYAQKRKEHALCGKGKGMVNGEEDASAALGIHKDASVLGQVAW